MKRIIISATTIMFLLLSILNVSATQRTFISIDDVTAQPGQTINVPIKISFNSGICGANLCIQYDANLLLTDVKNADALSSLSFTKPGKLSSNPVNLVWYGTDNDISNGTIAMLTFTVPSKPGKYDISVSYSDGDIVNGDLLSVATDTKNGSITVTPSQTDEPTIQDGSMIYIEDVRCDGGTSIDVPVFISQNPGICGANLTIHYDKNLTLVNVKNSVALSSLSFTKPGKLTANPINLVWYGVENDTTNGTIAVLTFDVPDIPNTYYIDISYNDGDIVNGNLESINPGINSGKIIVSQDKIITINIEENSLTLSGDKDESGYIIIAFYDDKGLKCMDCYDSDNNTININKPQNITHLKAMWWKNDGSLKPVCKVQTMKFE